MNRELNNLKFLINIAVQKGAFKLEEVEIALVSLSNLNVLLNGQLSEKRKPAESERITEKETPDIPNSPTGNE